MATPGELGPLAFVDVETTGLSPAANRIAEIGVITVDGDRIERWTTLVKTSPRRTPASGDWEPESLEAAPTFREIARALATRLSGRLLVAHNARFDHAFLKAEFDRVGIAFNPDVLCSVMLSRRLYPCVAHHDLDSLVEAHGLRASDRHRALPDADLVWQWWQMVNRQHSADVISTTIAALLSGPMLPPELDIALIERLPEVPGACVFHGEDNKPFLVVAAGNLKLYVLNYFRLDRATGRALEYVHRITNITWRATRGILGAQLQAAALDRVHFPARQRKAASAAFTWQLSPAAVPSVSIVPRPGGRDADMTETFGFFPSERIARNALTRFATKHRLCHCLVGLGESAGSACLACPASEARVACAGMIDRKKQLIRIFTAMKPLCNPVWPHAGPIGIRERSDIHVVDHWQFLGTARNEGELHGVLENHADNFDKRLCLLLNRTLSRLPRAKIVDLSGYDCGPDRSGQFMDVIESRSALGSRGPDSRVAIRRTGGDSAT